MLLQAGSRPFGDDEIKEIQSSDIVNIMIADTIVALSAVIDGMITCHVITNVY